MSKNGLRLFIVLLSSFLQKFLSNFNHITYGSLGSLRNQNYKNENAFGATKTFWYNWLISYIPEIFKYLWLMLKTKL